MQPLDLRGILKPQEQLLARGHKDPVRVCVATFDDLRPPFFDDLFGVAGVQRSERLLDLFAGQIDPGGQLASQQHFDIRAGMGALAQIVDVLGAQGVLIAQQEALQ